MTEGLGFLLAMLLEGIVAAALGGWLGPRLDLSRLGASARFCAASIIGTGVTHPAFWLLFARLVEIAGSWWAGALSGLCAAILVETPFCAAALRGHWRVSLVLSATMNTASFGAAMLINWVLVKPT